MEHREFEGTFPCRLEPVPCTCAVMTGGHRVTASDCELHVDHDGLEATVHVVQRAVDLRSQLHAEIERLDEIARLHDELTRLTSDAAIFTPSTLAAVYRQVADRLRAATCQGQEPTKDATRALP